MRLSRHALLLALAPLLWPAVGRGEPSQAIFYDVSPVVAGGKGRLDVAIDYLGFYEDDEYFSELVEGYTLFGSRLVPRLAYQPADHVRLEAGISWWHIHGDSGLALPDPFTRFKIQYGDLALVFGSLEGQLTHRLIDPLLDHERVITRPYETGWQARWDDGIWFADLWLDWVTMLRPRDPFQEQVEGGLSVHVKALQLGPVQVTLSAQGVGQHLGGTIDTAPEPLKTVFDGAAGFNVSFTGDGFLQSAWVEGYLLGYVDNSQSYTPPFQDGWALYGTVGTRMRHVGTIELAGWHGHGFINPLGAATYSSVSRRVFVTLPSQTVRQSLFLRLSNDIPVSENVFISFRAEGHLDLSQNEPGFSTGLYVGWRDVFAWTTLD